MTRLRCLSLCACLGLLLTTMACGSGGGSGVAKPWDQARLANTGTDWWINATKGAFFFSVLLANSYADTAGRASAISFTESVINKLTPSTTDPTSLMPAPTPDWPYDPNSTYSVNGPAVAHNNAEATDLVDGAADPLFDSTRSYQPVLLVWEVYDKPNSSPYETMNVKILQMASQANAGQIYNDLLTWPQYSDQAAGGDIPWSQCTGADPNPCGLPSPSSH